MECIKCNTQLLIEAKFCSNCGEKVPVSDFWETLKMAQNVWFYVGFLRGACPKIAKAKVKQLRLEHPELYHDYREAFKFTKKYFMEMIKDMEKDIKKNKKKK